MCFRKKEMRILFPLEGGAESLAVQVIALVLSTIVLGSFNVC